MLDRHHCVLHLLHSLHHRAEHLQCPYHLLPPCQLHQLYTWVLIHCILLLYWKHGPETFLFSYSMVLMEQYQILSYHQPPYASLQCSHRGWSGASHIHQLLLLAQSARQTPYTESMSSITQPLPPATILVHRGLLPYPMNPPEPSESPTRMPYSASKSRATRGLKTSR